MEKKAESTSSRRAVDAEDGPKEDLRPGGEEEKGAIHGAGNSGEHRPREYHRCDEMGNSGEPGPREWEPAH